MRSATVTAETTTRVLALSVQAFRSLASHYSIAMRMATELSRRVRENQGRPSRPREAGSAAR